MDWSNKEVLVNPNLSYTSRDYNSIYEELKAAIPSLTALYSPETDADPGVVLIKMISMLGDMLSFNLDNAALEAFPRTVLQLTNAQQLFRLVGYKMRWYQSARCECTITNANSLAVSIGRYNTFTATVGNITYTNLYQFEIPAGAAGNTAFKGELVQGRPVTPTKAASNVNVYTGEWHDQYNYNVSASQVINNRIYLKDAKIDGTTITLIDDDSSDFSIKTWERVDNLNTVTSVGKYFEFDFSEDGVPYIELPPYWNTRYAISRFKLFYVISDGEAGEVVDGAITSISSANVSVNGSTTKTGFMNYLTITNTASTYGYNPETPEEARRASENYINTADTIVTLTDFTKAVKRLTGIANAKATDLHTDPDGTDMVSNQVRIYVIRKPGYDNSVSDYPSTSYGYASTGISDEMWESDIIEALRSHIITKYDMECRFENSIDWIDWTIEGSLWMRQPIPSDKNHDILVKINDNLAYTFSPSILDFNEAINYIDVIDRIKASDKMIYHVDLSTAHITYSRIRRDTNGNPTGLTVSRRWRIYDLNGNYVNYYITGIGCIPNRAGNGDMQNAPYRILKETGSESITGLEFGDPNNVNEYELYTMYSEFAGKNVDEIFNWVQEERKDTNYYVSSEDDDGELIFIYKSGSSDPIYQVSERLSIIGEDGNETGDIFVRQHRDERGLLITDETLFTEDTAVYDIWDSKLNEWTGKFIRRSSGEMFIMRSDFESNTPQIYSMKKYYKEDTGEIVDRFGDPMVEPESDKVIRDAVAKEELTGRYEQTIEVSEDGIYSFYLGQDKDGNKLLDSIGNEIDGFPIKPNGFHMFIDVDRYVIHDNGYGRIVGSTAVLDGTGSIDYATGKVEFKLAMTPTSGTMKIVYYKNTIAMARYYNFDTDKFYTQPQFLRMADANRSLE